MDTDVELTKNLVSFLYDSAFFCTQHWREKYDINTAAFGSEKGAAILLELMNAYRTKPFILPNGECDLIANTSRERSVFFSMSLSRKLVK